MSRVLSNSTRMLPSSLKAHIRIRTPYPGEHRRQQNPCNEMMGATGPKRVRHPLGDFKVKHHGNLDHNNSWRPLVLGPCPLHPRRVIMGIKADGQVSVPAPLSADLQCHKWKTKHMHRNSGKEVSQPAIFHHAFGSVVSTFS